jgi:hypothetical protein
MRSLTCVTPFWPERKAVPPIAEAKFALVVRTPEGIGLGRPGRLDRRRQPIGLAMRPSAAVGEGADATILAAIEDLVARLPALSSEGKSHSSSVQPSGEALPGRRSRRGPTDLDFVFDAVEDTDGDYVQRLGSAQTGGIRG